MPSDYYAVLGVAPAASQDEIKKQYKKLAVKYHPDKTQDKDYHEKFLRVREAYDVLKDEESRHKYNREARIGINPSRPASSFAASRGYSYTTEHPFSRNKSRTSYGEAPFGSAFFDFYKRNTQEFTDHFSRFSQREAAKEQEERAAMYAEIARKKMKEDTERRQQDYLRMARKQREEEEKRHKMEETLRRQTEERTAATKAAQAAFASSRGFGDAGREYEHAKTEAYRRARETEMRAHTNSTASPDNDSSAEFIVIEDEEPSQSEEERESDGEEESGVKSESGHETQYGTSDREHDMEASRDDDLYSEQSASDDNDVHDLDEDASGAFNDPGSIPPADAASEYMNASFASGETEFATPPRHHPEVVEVPEESDYDATYNGDRAQQVPGNGYNTRSRDTYTPAGADFEKLAAGSQGPKKPRLSNYDSLKHTLEAFDDVDVSGLRSTLPQFPSRTRKASSSSTAQMPKRARHAEYTNGQTKAETLYTPVNKAYLRKASSTISTSDLSPEVDDFSLIFSVESPTFTVKSDMQMGEWNAYVTKINEYERKFSEYRKAVLEYQMGRLRKDERHHNVIYSDTSCLDVYQSCLFNDVLLLQNYTRALQEFRQTLKTFHVNCETKRTMEMGDRL